MEAVSTLKKLVIHRLNENPETRCKPHNGTPWVLLI